MYKPFEGVSRPDLDFFTFSDYYSQNPYKADAYLDTSGLTDVVAYRHFAKRHDWENALFHACRALQKGVNEREARMTSVLALRALGKPEEALDTLYKIPDNSYEVKLLEIDLLIDMRRFWDTDKRIRQISKAAPQEIQIQLDAMLKKSGTMQNSNRIMPDRE